MIRFACASRLRYAASAILLATAAFGQWRRVVQLDYSGWSDTPPPHTLAYFRVDPCSRPDPKDRLLQCTPNPSETELRDRLKTRTDLQVVGTIGTLTIYDLYYYFPNGDPYRPGLRSILIGQSRQRLHEILVHDTGPVGTLYPSEILRVEDQLILKVKADDGGIYHIVNEQYFAISEAGAILLDFAPVLEAANKVIPNEMVTYQPTSRYDLESLTFHIQTEKRDVKMGHKVSCCEGRVEVRFHIKQGLVIPGLAKFFPE